MTELRLDSEASCRLVLYLRRVFEEKKPKNTFKNPTAMEKNYEKEGRNIYCFVKQKRIAL